MNKIPCALTIAGTDPTGGAGIQADLKTFQELKSYGMSVITSVHDKNEIYVQDVNHVPLSTIETQLDSISDDIPVHAYKTGMISNMDMMEIIKQKIPYLDAPYLMDPVIVTTSGDTIIATEAPKFLKE